MSKKEAERIVPNENMAVISICGMDSERKLSNKWKHRIDLDFDDVDVAGSFTIVTKKGNVEIPYILFDENMARKVITFISSLPSNVNSIVVHCYAGISRSAAVAKFLCEEIYDENFPKYYMSYNKLVYRVLYETSCKMKNEESLINEKNMQ
jgi:predicted protein tyrosine phosphatase